MLNLTHFNMEVCNFRLSQQPKLLNCVWSTLPKALAKPAS